MELMNSGATDIAILGGPPGLMKLKVNGMVVAFINMDELNTHHPPLVQHIVFNGAERDDEVQELLILCQKDECKTIQHKIERSNIISI